MSETDYTTKNDFSEEFWFNANINNSTWNSKSCIYHRSLWNYIDIPETGYCVQLGSGFGFSLQILSEHFVGRTWGIDIWNPKNHPLIKEIDIRDLQDVEIAYVHCNIGNFNLTPNIRKIALEWSLRNLVSGGYCCTAGDHEFVENYLGYTIKDIAEKYDCKVMPIPLNKEIQKMNDQGKSHSMHDCLIKKR